MARDRDSGCQHRLKSTFLIGNVKAKHKSAQHLKIQVPQGQLTMKSQAKCLSEF